MAFGACPEPNICVLPQGAAGAIKGNVKGAAGAVEDKARALTHSSKDAGKDFSKCAPAALFAGLLSCMLPQSSVLKVRGSALHVANTAAVMHIVPAVISLLGAALDILEALELVL